MSILWGEEVGALRVLVLGRGKWYDLNVYVWGTDGGKVYVCVEKGEIGSKVNDCMCCGR